MEDTEDGTAGGAARRVSMFRVDLSESSQWRNVLQDSRVAA